MFRRLLIGMSLAALAACSQAKPAEEAPGAGSVAVTPQSVRALVESTSPTQAVATLWDNDGYSTFADGVARGDAAWLAVVPLIQPGTDGGPSTELQIALSTALPRNAAGVLALLPAHGEYGGVCVNSAIEYAELSPNETAASNAEYYRAAMPAVEAVSDPALAASKAACLASLRAAAAA